MSDIKIEDIEAGFEKILKLTGEDSFVNWEAFTKTSTAFGKTLEELANKIHILREIQHKRFINTMKKLKAADVPDLIKTVKAKKLPKEVLKTIAPRFKLTEGQLELACSVEELKGESKTIFDEYIGSIEAVSAKATETV